MEDTVLIPNRQLHLRYEGRSIDIPMAELDVGDMSTDEQIRNAVAENLGVPAGKLRAYAVDKSAGEITLRPEAVFG